MKNLTCKYLSLVGVAVAVCQASAPAAASVPLGSGVGGPPINSTGEAQWEADLDSLQGRTLRRVEVKSADELRRAVREATPGTSIKIAPGVYEGNFYFENVRGAKNCGIVIRGGGRAAPTIIRGGVHFSNASCLVLRDLVIEKSPSNGLSIDDGGKRDGSARSIVLWNIYVRDIVGRGNVDGIKLSGLDEFRLWACHVERWGDAGSAIDMVGCHTGYIRGGSFRFAPGQGDSGVQAKGGSRDIVIQGAQFRDAGSRAINAGGSTGLAFFRPPLEKWFKGEPKFEAKNIHVLGCTFVGSEAALAFVGVDGALVRSNTIYRPRRWAMRILQETTEPGFVGCRNVHFERNLVVWDAANWIEGGVNIGPGTQPASFSFKNNWWFCQDKPESSRPNLPTPETGGIYGRDPMIEEAEDGSLWLKKGSAAPGAGATLYQR